VPTINGVARLGISGEDSMSDSELKPPMASENDYVLQSSIRPSPFDLGVTYEGAILEGSLHITCAKEIHKVHIDKPNGLEVLELHPYWTGKRGLIWKFRARTDVPIKFLAFVGFWTDLGKTSTHFSLEIKAGFPPGGRLLFCQSPFDASSSHWTHANLNLVTRELELQTNTTNDLPEDISPFNVVVLHCAGLRYLVQGSTNMLNRYLEAGGKVILLADHCYSNTVMHANRLMEPHGIRLEDREYNEVLCDHSHIEEHRVTTGIRRLRWFRPSPMVTRASAKVLVRNPERPDEGFLACGGPHQNLFAVGSSMLHSLVCEGWPFDNGQLLANLLNTR